MGRKMRVKKLEGTPYVIEVDNDIGSGSFSTVKRAFDTENMSKGLVCKVIAADNQRSALTIKSELQMMKELPAHPNLVNYERIQITSSHNLYVFMEYCNQGNLERYIHNSRGSLTEDDIWSFLRQFCAGYSVLFDRKIIHRDIKPENILIHQGIFKIADFGLAKIVEDNQVVSNLSVRGTPLYMAPELQKYKEGSAKIDLFSLGVIIYRMAFKGEYPFFDLNRRYHSVQEYFQELNMRKLVIPPSNRSPELVELIDSMLKKNHEQRIGWENIFNHPKVVQSPQKQGVTLLENTTPLINLKRSIVIANRSHTKMTILKRNDQSQTELVVEQAFEGSHRSDCDRQLYHHKISYMLIEAVNSQLKTLFIQNGLKGTLPSSLIGKLKALVKSGYQYAIWIILRSKSLVGELSCLHPGQTFRYEEIFDKDHRILLQKLKQLGENSQNLATRIEQSSNGQYEGHLYDVLSEFMEYSSLVRQSLHSIVGLLIDIYDIVVRKLALTPEQKPRIQLLEDESIDEFKTYLEVLESITEPQILTSLKKKALVIF